MHMSLQVFPRRSLPWMGQLQTQWYGSYWLVDRIFIALLDVYTIDSRTANLSWNVELLRLSYRWTQRFLCMGECGVLSFPSMLRNLNDRLLICLSTPSQPTNVGNFCMWDVVFLRFHVDMLGDREPNGSYHIIAERHPWVHGTGAIVWRAINLCRRHLQFLSNVARDYHGGVSQQESAATTRSPVAHTLSGPNPCMFHSPNRPAQT